MSSLLICSQVCSSIGNVVLDQAYAGFNTTLFTYGAKATGKSSMLYGKAKEDGIITFTLKGLFHMAGEYDTKTSFRCEIRYNNLFLLLSHLKVIS